LQPVAIASAGPFNPIEAAMAEAHLFAVKNTELI
jgi:hypothetical protein